MTKFLIINGPNLDLLGSRETEIYGNKTLDDINASLQELAKPTAVDLKFFQSNAEHEIIEAIHQAKQDKVNFIIINPAGLTHTSVVLRDALLAVSIPFIEVHLSNPEAREPFRHTSLISDIAKGKITGMGPYGYELALMAALYFC